MSALPGFPWPTPTPTITILAAQSHIPAPRPPLSTPVAASWSGSSSSFSSALAPVSSFRPLAPVSSLLSVALCTSAPSSTPTSTGVAQPEDGRAHGPRRSAAVVAAAVVASVVFALVCLAVWKLWRTKGSGAGRGCLSLRSRFWAVKGDVESQDVEKGVGREEAMHGGAAGPACTSLVPAGPGVHPGFDSAGGSGVLGCARVLETRRFGGGDGGRGELSPRDTSAADVLDLSAGVVCEGLVDVPLVEGLELEPAGGKAGGGLGSGVGAWDELGKFYGWSGQG
ncbi:hypothetical protein K505DRAFT_420560 [Melanomma pulvis-pyrius CBS 109.77]|uniref:Uncharacterized protein n=1 Tax=Melanomma pulvis-pyrius CBS 109.77 TaxID=1314802 RepID=A0A6A6X055_9PLEO|nr:hypothetical protein K505DRAFT_420560 [Melanomma pulvis-pyrius CBS 109.77]